MVNDAVLKGALEETGQTKRGMLDDELHGAMLTRFCDLQVVKQTIRRARDESTEDKKARKQAVKAERQARRMDKKTLKEQFSSEMKHQAQGLSNMGRIRKL